MYKSNLHDILIELKRKSRITNDKQIIGKLPHTFNIVHKVYFVCHDFSVVPYKISAKIFELAPKINVQFCLPRTYFI